MTGPVPRTELGNLSPQHGLRHKLTPDGRESLAHMFMFPKLKIAGYFYPSVRGDGVAKGRFCLFGPGIGTEIDEEFETHVPDSMGFEDWRAGNLEMAVREPLKIIDIKWHSARIQLTGRYEAYHPAYAFSAHPQGNPPYYGDDRTEQHGRFTGELVVDGKRHEIDDHMVRDHSWGPRVWGLNQHYKWIHATTGERSMHFFEMWSFGKLQLRGFLFKDGKIQHLANVDYDMTYDDNMMQKTVTAIVTDLDGRCSKILFDSFANTIVDLDPKILLYEAACTIDFDGEPGSGWAEFCWSRDYVEYARQHVSRFYV